MKICFFTYDKPGEHAGPVVNLRRLLPRLKEQGADASCLVIHRGSSSPCSSYLREQGVECHVLRWKNVTRHHIGWIFDRLERIQPDVFVPNASVPACYAARWARDAGIPTVAAFRGDNAFYWQLIDQFVLGEECWRVSGLLCVSSELKERVRRRGTTSSRIAVIPSGVPISAQPVATHHPFRVTYIGRLQEEQKRISGVMDAICQVLERVPAATALVIGAGAALKACRRTTHARGLADRTQFLTDVSSEGMSQALANSSVAILLSDYEGTPGALMDAMASGLVPVTRRTPGGVLELVEHGETGIVVNDTSSDPLAVASAVNSIVQLAENQKQWLRLSENARQRVKEHYSVGQSVDGWLQFGQALLEQNEAPRKQFKAPRQIPLPPVRRPFAREDVRWWNIYRRTKGSIGRALGLT